VSLDIHPDADAVELAVSLEAALEAVDRAAEAWGAEFQRQQTGGMLHLPTVGGLRRGVVSGPVSVEAAVGGTRVTFRSEESIQAVQTAPLVVLVLALGGAALTVLWPFFPNLLPLSPFGALLALGGWFLVLSRLRNHGPREFLAAVAAEAGSKGV
jgi:hypothetical protein